MRAVFFVLALMLAGGQAMPARAADAPLPLGLEKFRWGMNIVETTPFFASIGERVPGPSDVGMLDHTLVYFAPYRWQSCTFTATLGFYDGKLNHANLQMLDAGATCTRAVLEELRKHFGPETKGAELSWPEPRVWEQSGTKVIFNYRVWLSAPGAPPITSMDLPALRMQ